MAFPTEAFDEAHNAPARWDIALGNTQVDQVVKFGSFGPAAAGDAPADVWSTGGDYTGMPVEDPSAATTVDVVSSSALDTAAGTGAQTIRVFGLNEEGLPVQEDIILDGITPVVSTKNYHRLNRAKVLTAGSGETNAGIITISRTGAGAVVFAEMEVGLAQTQITAFTIPADKTGLLTGLWVSIGLANGNSGSAGTTLRVRPPGGVFNAGRNFVVTTAFPINPITLPVKFGPLTDVKLRIEDISDNNTTTTGEFDILLFDNIE